VNKSHDNFAKLMLLIKELDPSQTLDLPQPLDLALGKRTLSNYAVTVGNIWKLVLETVTLKTD
jgi:hypothetical protein